MVLTDHSLLSQLMKDLAWNAISIGPAVTLQTVYALKPYQVKFGRKSFTKIFFRLYTQIWTDSHIFHKAQIKTEFGRNNIQEFYP